MFYLFIYYLLSTQDLRETWADRRKILHDGQYYWAQFYNAGPKFLGVFPKKIVGAKTCKI